MKKAPFSTVFFHLSLSITPFSFVIFLLSFFLITCSTSTNSDKQVVFSGTVTLEGETDFSGVTVSLYNPVELDPSNSRTGQSKGRTGTVLVRINREYPNIGVQISQETEFDLLPTSVYIETA